MKFSLSDMLFIVLNWVLFGFVVVGSVYYETIFFNMENVEALVKNLHNIAFALCITYVAKQLNNKSGGGGLLEALRKKISNAYYNAYICFGILLECVILGYDLLSIGFNPNHTYRFIYAIVVIVSLAYFFYQLSPLKKSWR